jgi:hypothetical protein
MNDWLYVQYRTIQHVIKSCKVIRGPNSERLNFASSVSSIIACPHHGPLMLSLSQLYLDSPWAHGSLTGVTEISVTEGEMSFYMYRMILNDLTKLAIFLRAGSRFLHYYLVFISQSCSLVQVKKVNY